MAESPQNPLLDLGTTTVSAFNIIKDQEKEGKSALLGVDDNAENTPNNTVCVYVYTPQDKQKHRYFHSLSIDKQVEDFMGTAELRCPFDSDLMHYWEPITNYCVIYGSNKGEANAKILFIGRVRGVRQEGYELVIEFQDPYWKFKQLVTQSYANDNVLNKDGYTIMKIMFAALKFDSWVISPIAKSRLKQVGFDQDGNLTLNKEKIEEMPDLLERLKKSNPRKAINNWTVYNKEKESKEGNLKNINYTLKYEKPTKVMKKIASEGKSSGFSPGKSVYGTTYGSASSDGSSNGGGSSGNNTNYGGGNPPANLCSSIGNTEVINAMKTIWAYNRGYINDYGSARDTILNYARNSPATYSSRATACLATLSKYSTRKNGVNAAQVIKSSADWEASKSGAIKTVVNTGTAIVNGAKNVIQSGVNAISNGIKTITNWGGAIMKAVFG